MTAFHVMAGASGEFARPEVRKIGIADIADALRLGLEDFKEKPSHYFFLCLMYPIAGVFMVMWSAGANMLPLIYPLMSGFALMGVRIKSWTVLNAQAEALTIFDRAE